MRYSLSILLADRVMVQRYDTSGTVANHFFVMGRLRPAKILRSQLISLPLIADNRL